jgi:hypothetical protein
MKSPKNLKMHLPLLTVFLSCVSVFAHSGDNNESQRATPMLGVLVLEDSDSTLINGNTVVDGATIRSGAEIRTGNHSARIYLPKLGSIELRPNTSINVSFNDNTIDLNLFSGQAQLTASEGVRGKLINPDGALFETDSSLSFSTVGSAGETFNSGSRSEALSALNKSIFESVYETFKNVTEKTLETLNLTGNVSEGAQANGNGNGNGNGNDNGGENGNGCNGQGHIRGNGRNCQVSPTQ